MYPSLLYIPIYPSGRVFSPPAATSRPASPAIQGNAPSSAAGPRVLVLALSTSHLRTSSENAGGALRAKSPAISANVWLASESRIAFSARNITAWIAHTPFVAHDGGRSRYTAQRLRISWQSNKGFLPSIASTTSRTVISWGCFASRYPPLMPSDAVTIPAFSSFGNTFATKLGEIP
ncbi:Hypothetical protein NGAL_HAMBI1189_11880 [Neorhizobium galegae bv. officinalis]|uniref:Uncharacterized protein n=1 Tax=Neorhizobium galegae bv. officinalis TaxID=323656 RepID=A0A0T7GFF9_NEOGA|nr:Hypothetical protein NGAL_HAMBI1189_11880 [Neorhizobium galegae bv. officinalis]